MVTWRCVKNCGACCNLEPGDRSDLEDYLTAQELAVYMSMVGDGGWCINYDQQKRECKIYEQRPRFCRVLPDVFEDMYGIDETEFNDFAIDCCHQQIEGVYGDDSPEMQRYDQELEIG